MTDGPPASMNDFVRHLRQRADYLDPDRSQTVDRHFLRDAADRIEALTTGAHQPCVRDDCPCWHQGQRSALRDLAELRNDATELLHGLTRLFEPLDQMTGREDDGAGK